MKQLTQFEIWAEDLTGAYGTAIKKQVTESESLVVRSDQSDRRSQLVAYAKKQMAAGKTMGEVIDELYKSGDLNIFQIETFEKDLLGQKWNESVEQTVTEGTLTSTIARPIKAWASHTNSEVARDIGISLGLADIRAVAMGLLELSPKMRQKFLSLLQKIEQDAERKGSTDTKRQAEALHKMLSKFIENAPERQELAEFDEGITSNNPQGIPESGHGYSNVPQMLPEERLADKIHEVFHKKFGNTKNTTLRGSDDLSAKRKTLQDLRADPVSQHPEFKDAIQARALQLDKEASDAGMVEEYDPSFDPEYRPYQRPERDPDWDREMEQEREWEEERRKSNKDEMSEDADAGGKTHISPSGVKTSMSPTDDDYEINYGKDGLVAKDRKSRGVDVATGTRKVTENWLDDSNEWYEMVDTAKRQIIAGKPEKDVLKELIAAKKLDMMEVQAFMRDLRGEKWNESVERDVSEEYDPSYDPDYRPYQRPERDADWDREEQMARDAEDEEEPMTVIIKDAETDEEVYRFPSTGGFYGDERAAKKAGYDLDSGDYMVSWSRSEISEDASWGEEQMACGGNDGPFTGVGQHEEGEFAESTVAESRACALKYRKLKESLAARRRV